MRHAILSPLSLRNACLLIFLLIAGCVEPDISPGAPSADPARVPHGEHPADEELGEDPLMLALARQNPSFAGVFFEPGTSRLVVASTSTDARNVAALRQTVLTAVGTELGHPQTADGGLALNAVHRVFEYSFLELARLRARIRSHVLGIPEVQSLSVDEQHNRIKIGLSDPFARAKIEQIATDLAIPIQMLSFAHASPGQPLYGTSRPPFVGTPQDSTLPGPPTLRDSITVPDNMLRGGYMIEVDDKYQDNRFCTLGFTASQRHVVNYGRFVTNSHCSLLPHEKDNGIWHQPEVRSEFSQVGYEIRDRRTHRCKVLSGKIRIWADCRHSDAALAFPILGPTDEPIRRNFARGEIGRTTERSDCEACEAEITIDTVTPVIRIKGTRTSILVGETLDKVGQRTGWTYGTVLETCVDKPDSDDPNTRVFILCTGVISFAVGRGDSGSPVFQYLGSTETTQDFANLVGILWGGNDFRTRYLAAKGLISPFHKIEEDLGWLFSVCHGSGNFERCDVPD